MKILVVDDLATNRKLLRVVLEPEGYTVVEAADGLEALALLERESVGAIITDILMPRMDGYRLCYSLRKDDRFKHLPIIISSSTYTSPADEKLALHSGADRYFKKPAPTKALLEALRELTSDPNHQRRRTASLGEEGAVMKEYNQVLVRKLEEKNSELEHTQAELQRINKGLEERVKERTTELAAANMELEAFNQSVAHDLRNPLSVVLGFSQLLLKSKSDSSDAKEKDCVGRIAAAAERMRALIEDLMKLSSIKEEQVGRKSFDLSGQVRAIAEKLRETDPEREVQFKIAPAIVADADERLVRIAMENLLANAWKFTAKSPAAIIEFGQRTQDGATVYFVRDNGAGFDMANAKKLFRAFARLWDPLESTCRHASLSIL